MDENDEWDGPWKDALDHLIDVFSLFWPDALADLDLAKGWSPLEQELQAFTPGGNSKLLRVDKLFATVAPKTGDPRYLHFEAQVPKDLELPWRMFKYGRRAGEYFNQPVGRFVVLGDDEPKWRPTEYREGILGCEDTFTFRIAKVVDWRGRTEELEAGDNLFGLFVCAHLETMATQGDPSLRAEAKFRLLSNLLHRDAISEAARQKIREWYRLIDWIMKLPEETNRAVWRRLETVKEPNPMSYVPFAERYYTEIGVAKGIEQGIKKGIEHGVAQGVAQGHRDSLREMLVAKFPDDGAALAAAFESETDAGRLMALVRAAALAQSPDDFRARVAAT